MYSVLILMLLMIFILGIFSVAYMRAGKWFQKAKLGELIMASEECKNLDELQNIVNEAEKLKLEMLGCNNEANSYYLKTNDALYYDADFVDTSKMNLGQLIKHFSNDINTSQTNNVIELFEKQ